MDLTKTQQDQYDLFESELINADEFTDMLAEIEECKIAVLSCTEKSQWKWILFYSKQVMELTEKLHNHKKSNQIALRIFRKLL